MAATDSAPAARGEVAAAATAEAAPPTGVAGSPQGLAVASPRSPDGRAAQKRKPAGASGASAASGGGGGKKAKKAGGGGRSLHALLTGAQRIHHVVMSVSANSLQAAVAAFSCTEGDLMVFPVFDASDADNKAKGITDRFHNDVCTSGVLLVTEGDSCDVRAFVKASRMRIASKVKNPRALYGKMAPLLLSKRVDSLMQRAKALRHVTRGDGGKAPSSAARGDVKAAQAFITLAFAPGSCVVRLVDDPIIEDNCIALQEVDDDTLATVPNRFNVSLQTMNIGLSTEAMSAKLKQLKDLKEAGIYLGVFSTWFDPGSSIAAAMKDSKLRSFIVFMALGSATDTKNEHVKTQDLTSYRVVNMQCKKSASGVEAWIPDDSNDATVKRVLTDEHAHLDAPLAHACIPRETMEAIIKWASSMGMPFLNVTLVRMPFTERRALTRDTPVVAIARLGDNDSVVLINAASTNLSGLDTWSALNLETEREYVLSTLASRGAGAGAGTEGTAAAAAAAAKNAAEDAAEGAGGGEQLMT